MDEPAFVDLSKQKFGGMRYAMTKDMNMAELVALAVDSGRELARALLLSRLEEDPQRDPEQAVCRRCQGKLRIQERSQRRAIKTALGEIEYHRAYGVCDRCGHTAAPLDETLGIPPSGPSVEMRQRICHAAVTARSFETAAEILAEHDGISLSSKHVRVISEMEGRRVAQERQREMERLSQGEQPKEGDGPPLDLIVVTADGGRIQTRQMDATEGVWREDKIGAVYDATPKPDEGARTADEYEGAKAGMKTFTASLANWNEFGWMLYAEAINRGYERGKEKVFISDGAPCLRGLRETHFPKAIFILDWYHAAQHLSACAKAAFCEGTEECSRWYRRMKEKLWEGDVDAILRAIEKESIRVGKPGPKEAEGSPRVILHRNIGYFNDNRKGVDYPSFRAKGWPIGSGVAEGAVKQFGMRLKGSEKFWNGFGNGLGAEEMLALCALHRSEDGRWETYWTGRARPAGQVIGK